MFCQTVQTIKMMKILLISVFVIAQVINLQGQEARIDLIQEKVHEINADSTLTAKEVDATEIFGQAFDGGGIIKVFSSQNRIKKIHLEIGVSFGRLTTIIYFENGKPLKITDREENFKWLEDQTGWDYSELNQVFQADVFVFDWETGENKTIKQGERKLSEGTNAIFDYKPLTELAKELMKK